MVPFSSLVGYVEFTDIGEIRPQISFSNFRYKSLGIDRLKFSITFQNKSKRFKNGTTFRFPNDLVIEVIKNSRVLSLFQCRKYWFEFSNKKI